MASVSSRRGLAFRERSTGHWSPILKLAHTAGVISGRLRYLCGQHVAVLSELGRRRACVCVPSRVVNQAFMRQKLDVVQSCGELKSPDMRMRYTSERESVHFCCALVVLPLRLYLDPCLPCILDVGSAGVLPATTMYFSISDDI